MRDFCEDVKYELWVLMPHETTGKRAMGNLGDYQEFSTIAKSFGGVENYIKAIESSAVDDAVKKLAGAGALAGLGVVAVAGTVVFIRSKYREREAAAEEAKTKLKDLFDGNPESDNDDGDEGPIESAKDSGDEG